MEVSEGAAEADDDDGVIDGRHAIHMLRRSLQAYFHVWRFFPYPSQLWNQSNQSKHTDTCKTFEIP